MARKTRKKSAAKTKRKPSAVSKKKRKTVTKKKSKAAARKKAARKAKPTIKSNAKPKGVVGTIVADVEAVMDTLTEAERLHRKLEPHVSREPE